MNKEVIIVKKVFDRYNYDWRNSAIYNLEVVRMILNICYLKLKSKGYLFLNEVYQEFGFPMTKEGQVAGWVFSEDIIQDYMWWCWTENDCNDVFITFEPLVNITNILPNETKEL